MAIDTSIYQNVGNVKPIEVPDFAASAQKALGLSSLALQNQQMQRQMAVTQAARALYSKHMGQDGTLDQKGYLSELARLDPQTALAQQELLGKADKGSAEAKAAQADAAQKMYSVTGPAFDYLAKLPESDRSQAYPQIIQQLKDQGIDVSRMDHPYNPKAFTQYYGAWQSNKDKLANVLTQAQIGKAQSETMMAPAKLNAEIYGPRSPNAELTSQYDKQAAPIRSSQISMKQMMDNYNHPSPQGDASLILNAFKIKFPTAPDVNSLKELSESQAASDQWKQIASHALKGGLDQGTRDNLMRDGVSTYRANVESLRDIQEKYQARARQQNVNDPTLTAEPGVERTYADAMKLQDKVGPYVPPTERGGMMAGLTGLASKIAGVGGSDKKPPRGSDMFKSAYAAPPKIKPGTIEDGHVYMGGDPGSPSSWKKAQ